MTKPLISLLRTILPKVLVKQLNRIRNSYEYKKWLSQGSPVPPPHIVKQITISEFQVKYNYSILIETGTYMGGMIEAQRHNFKRIISIELDETLYKNAQNRFKNNNSITIVNGDSGKVLPEVLKNISEPVIFWLDGHFSSGVTAKGDLECPIFEEMDAIFASKKLNHLILIDDARCFNGTADYPTIESFIEYVGNKNSNYKVSVKNDIIICEI